MHSAPGNASRAAMVSSSPILALDSEPLNESDANTNLTASIHPRYRSKSNVR